MEIYAGAKNKIFFKNLHGDICWWGYMLVHHCSDNPEEQTSIGAADRRRTTRFK